jgi:hypothetical protein
MFGKCKHNFNQNISKGDNMSFVIYHKETTVLLGGFMNHKEYATRGTARAARNRLAKAGKIVKSHYKIADATKFFTTIEKKETVHNLMTGKPVVQSVNTPRCCDPSSELYWTM